MYATSDGYLKINHEKKYWILLYFVVLLINFLPLRDSSKDATIPKESRQLGQGILNAYNKKRILHLTDWLLMKVSSKKAIKKE